MPQGQYNLTPIQNRVQATAADPAAAAQTRVVERQSIFPSTLTGIWMAVSRSTKISVVTMTDAVVLTPCAVRQLVTVISVAFLLVKVLRWV